ncbi:MAG: RNA polymerase sigma factor [Oscillospiraceae bacterium]
MEVYHDLIFSVQFSVAYPDITPETELIREEDTARINAALDKLSETQKRRLLMFADGLSANEIARKEGVAPNAAWKSIEGAKKKFKKHF